MKRLPLFVIVLLGLLLVGGIAILAACSQQAGAAIPQPTIEITPTPGALPAEMEEQIRRAVEQAIEEEKAASVIFIVSETLIDRIQVSQDGNWATAQLTPLDPDTKHPIPVEPGLALVVRQEQGWQAFLPSNPLWVIVLSQMPDDLIAPEFKAEWMQIAEFRLEAAPSAPIGGYKLPYAGGDTMYLTQSVGHDRYTPSGSAHFAFDFAKPGYPSGLFNVHAARSGRVKQAVWQNENGNESKANYLVLEDTSTSPVTYQLYLHLAKDSIPADLRVVGAPVRRGQFIGVADDTGVSSGNHLHFHVHTYAYSYWGTSIDITFEDVPINGGRPRINSDLPYCKTTDVCDNTQTAYLSNNFMVPDPNPPTGQITNPSHGSVVSTNPTLVAGTASDDISGVAKVQLLARYGGAWYPLDPTFNSSPFSTNWDVCLAGVPEGPVTLAVEVQDKALNQNNKWDTLVHYVNNVSCPLPAPACVPSTNQVALYAAEEYSGACILLGVGTYPNASYLGSLGDNRVVSVRVGANVQVALYADASYKGRAETLRADDPSLQDNRLGANTVSSVIVQARSAAPSKPAVVWPLANAAFDRDASLSLAWQDSGGGMEFQAQVLAGGSPALTTPWTRQTFWHFGPLAPGTYTWQVKARNSAGESGWTAAQTFTIQNSAAAPGTPVNVPFTHTMETSGGGWSASPGWATSADANHTPGGAWGWRYNANAAQGYDNGAPNAGYLTSPPINIPSSGGYYLRFYYQYETEGPFEHWDQRLVQISANNGPFETVQQITGDPPNFWLKSPAISLARYAGQSIRLRFYFATLDKAFNNYRGWYIDDVSITSQASSACLDPDENDLAKALPLPYNTSLSTNICPNGDVDYFVFQAAVNDQIGVRTRAQVNGSPLDTRLYLLAADGRSVLAENDDQVLYQRSDSYLSYRFSQAGVYYLKVQAWDHPSAGGPGYNYTIDLYNEKGDPSASFLAPKDGSMLNMDNPLLQVGASDAGSGVSRVRFFWHSSDWQSGDWVFVGEDWNGADGWSIRLNTASLPGYAAEQGTGAVFALVYDWAGNSIGAGAWNLRSASAYLPLILKPR